MLKRLTACRPGVPLALPAQRLESRSCKWADGAGDDAPNVGRYRRRCYCCGCCTRSVFRAGLPCRAARPPHTRRPRAPPGCLSPPFSRGLPPQEGVSDLHKSRRPLTPPARGATETAAAAHPHAAGPPLAAARPTLRCAPEEPAEAAGSVGRWGPGSALPVAEVEAAGAGAAGLPDGPPGYTDCCPPRSWWSRLRPPARPVAGRARTAARERELGEAGEGGGRRAARGTRAPGLGGRNWEGTRRTSAAAAEAAVRLSRRLGSDGGGVEFGCACQAREGWVGGGRERGDAQGGWEGTGAGLGRRVRVVRERVVWGAERTRLELGDPWTASTNPAPGLSRRFRGGLPLLEARGTAAPVS